MKIVIEGNIGGGKSTVLNMISQKTRLPIFLEPVDTYWKEGLDYFYNDNSRWGFTFNLNVLMTYNKWKDNSFKAIYERCPLSSKEVFSELQYDSEKMTKYEHDLYLEFYHKLAWEPEVMIYIRTPSNICYERMNSRGRECESSVPLSYLTKVEDKYEKLCKTIQEKNNIKLFIVNGDQDVEKVYEDVVKIINTL
jgi:deoxyadenosine/deoxycytidine kinase